MLDLTLLGYNQIILFAGSFILSLLALFITVKLAPPRRRTIIGRPPAHYAGLIIIVTLTLFSWWQLNDQSLSLSLLAGAVLAIIVGTRDEAGSLSPSLQLLGQLAIAIIVVIGGWTITYVSQPWGQGVLYLPAAGLITIIWLVFLMNAVNWLDGSDGLAGSVATVAFFTLAAVSLLPSTQDAQTLKLSLIGAGVVIAFLFWNWPPAKVYLGTSGSWFLGLYLGLVALTGGGKIATTLLVLAWPAFDALLVIIQRLLSGRAPWHGDTTSHLHHKLKALGLSSQTISLIALLVTGALGYAAVTLQTNQKIWTLLTVGVIFTALSAFLWYSQANRPASR